MNATTMNSFLNFIAIVVVVSSGDGWTMVSGYKFEYDYAKSGLACVKVETTNPRIDITYETKNGTRTQTVPIADATDVGGSCSDDTPSVHVKGFPDRTALRMVQFSFTRTPRPKGLSLMRIIVGYNAMNLKDSIDKRNYVEVHMDSPLTLTNVNRSYYCNLTQEYRLSKDVSFMTDVIQAQGFHMVNGTFSNTIGSHCYLLLITSPTAVDTTTTENIPTETTVMESTTMETAPTETTNMDTTSTDITPTDITPTDITPTDTTPTDTIPTDTTPTDTTPTDTTPTETVPTDTTPTDTMPTDTTPTDTTPTDTTPTGTMPTKPTAIPPMVNNTFSVKDNNQTCLLLGAAIELQIDYVHDKKNKTMNIAVPSLDNLSQSGICHTNSNLLRFNWTTLQADVMVSLEFTKTTSGHNFTMSGANVLYTIYESDKDVSGSAVGNMTRFSTNIGSYFMCNNDTKIVLDDMTTLEMKYVRLQGFREKSTDKFYGDVNNCWEKAPPKKVADTVIPIVMGSVLGAVVVIVLIGYCVARRKQSPSRSGYKTLS